MGGASKSFDFVVVSATTGGGALACVAGRATCDSGAEDPELAQPARTTAAAATIQCLERGKTIFDSVERMGHTRGVRNS